MSLAKLFEMQLKLDGNIIKNKKLQDHDLLPKKILALEVELGELANEWRGFKFWSDDQEPRKEPYMCKNCDEYNVGFSESNNPLLEEYVDCMHFFLSIANEKGWQDHLYILSGAVEDLREEGFAGGVTGAFSEVIYFLSRIAVEKNENRFYKPLGLSKHEFFFRSAWFVFICIGLIEFDFSFDQIEKAYKDKNAVNFERQDLGY